MRRLFFFIAYALLSFGFTHSYAQTSRTTCPSPQNITINDQCQWTLTTDAQHWRPNSQVTHCQKGKSAAELQFTFKAAIASEATVNPALKAYTVLYINCLYENHTNDQIHLIYSGRANLITTGSGWSIVSQKPNLILSCHGGNLGECFFYQE